MTIETYYNFLKIVECGSILAASQELLIAQPSLSTQLKNLEKSLGATLVERGSKQLCLTPAGEIFYQKAQAICSLDTELRRELQDYLSGTAGTLRISMTPSNPADMLHTLFDRFVREHPQVHFQFQEALSGQVAENVRMGLSEIGIIRSRIRNVDDFHVLPFRSEEIMVLLSTSHPLAKYSSLTLEQIKNERIATTDMIAPMVETAFRTIHAEPRFYLKTAIRRTALFWISSYQNCIALLHCSPDEAGREQDGCRILRISDYDFSVRRSFIILRNRKLSPLGREFLRSVGAPCDFPDA
ncbi:MAG: LysR family transcriptional regulator [Eubacteriales bacterium]|nr:LysR family transcriptional regulator [Eubacteriales bacterium]